MQTLTSPQLVVAGPTATKRHKPGAVLSRKERQGQSLTPETGAKPTFFAPAIQAKCACCHEDEKPVVQAKADSSQPDLVQTKCADYEHDETRPHENTPAIQQSADVSSVNSARPNSDFSGGLTVGKPNDRFEREADQMGEQVSRMPVSGFSGLIFTTAPAPLQRHEEEEADVQTKLMPATPSLQRKADGGLQTSGQFTNQVQASAGGGTALPSSVQQGMSSAFQADFSSVRIHTDTQAAQLSNDIGARAFTYQNNIYFNDNQYNPSSSEGRFLLAHELTHTVQQGASVKRVANRATAVAPRVQPSSFEETREVDHARPAQTVQVVQRDEEPVQEESLWDKLKNVGASALKSILPARIYGIFISIRDKGIIGFIKESIFKLFEGLLKDLGFSNQQITLIFQVFATLADRLPAILQAVKAGDCKPLFEAMNLLSEVVGAIAGRVWDQLMDKLEPIRLWLIDLWDTYAAPAIDAIKAFAGELWEDIKDLGKRIWDWFKPVRDKIASAWDWVVEKLGFGSSDEPGLLGIISQKLSSAWTEIKGVLKPVIEPVKEIINGIKSLISLEYIKKLQKDATEWLDHVAKTATEMGGEDDSVAKNQLSLRTVVLPTLNKSIDTLKSTLRTANDWLVGQINGMAGQVNGFVTGFQQSTYLSPLFSLVAWVPKQIDAFKDWADTKVTTIFNDIQQGADRLRTFIEPVISLLEKLIKVVGNLLGYLPDLILGVPWMFLPRCIKDPITKWITEVILKQIPIISEFITFTEKWDEIKSAALLILKQVFLDGQLAKGLWTYFKTLMGILGIDPQLVTQVIAKAAQNFSAIISKPVDFLKNVWQAIKGGFSLFFENIWTHLPKGALDWLFGEVKGAVKVTPPKEFSIGSILGYVLDLFGISKDNVYDRMRKHPKIGPEKVKTIQKIEKILTGVLEWITVWIQEGPEGLLKKIKKELGDLKTMVINGVVSWVTTTITAAITKKLLTSSDPSGIGAILTTIKTVYDTIKAGVAYFNRILNLVNSVMDSTAEIIAGNTKAASEYLEGVLAKAVPVVIGFAVEAVIGPVGNKIQEIVTSAREKVDETIDTLINAAIGAIDLLKSAAGKALEWFGIKKPFTADNGEPHELSFKGKDASAQLFIASTNPQKYAVWVTSIKIDGTTEAGKKRLVLQGKAKAKAGEIDTIKAKKETEKFTADDKETQMANLLNDLAELTGPLFAGNRPDWKEPTWGGLHAGLYATRMNALQITKNKMPAGSIPSVTHDSFATLNQRRNQGGSYYILGHLLNQRLGGTGSDWRNLTPLTRSANSQHEVDVERLVKQMVTEGNIIKYRVTPVYSRSSSTRGLENAVDRATLNEEPDTVKDIIRQEVHVPTALDCEASMVNPDTQQEVPLLTTTVANVIDQTPEAYDLVGKKRAPIYLQTDSAKKIATIGAGVDLELAGKIKMAFKQKAREDESRFSSYESLRNFESQGKNFFTPSEKNILRKIEALSFVKLF